MKIGQILFWTGVAFVAIYFVTQPTAAGHLVWGVLGGVKAAGNDLANWFNSI